MIVYSFWDHTQWCSGFSAGQLRALFAMPKIEPGSDTKINMLPAVLLLRLHKVIIL